MPHCPSCGAEAVEGARFCAACAIALDRTSAPTETSLRGTRASDGDHASFDSGERARFVPGTILDRRYRILGLLGRGGMGEVYRADDLKLGRAVALKFLPADLERDARRLDRFLNEARVALKVTHPNVCRVHDIAEVGGRHYISMEYIDGEDLASLLRRIGRLPGDKAVQIARQLCAGLAAAHDEGILHRDLKPANVMIDGRGRAKITDFGLASLTGAIDGAEVVAGTPAYMAPEQAEGREVTVRSDVYALGLVLYELFTGKRAFEASSLAQLRRLQSESTPTRPASIVEGLDPAIERAILRCLKPEPSERAASPLVVAASLPGGDPLAAALAAGETPSPEMVAAAGGDGALQPRTAVACLVLIVGLFGSFMVLSRMIPGFHGGVSWASIPHPPQVLAQKAAEILESLGHDAPAADRAYGMFYDTAYFDWIEANDDAVDRWSRARNDAPPPLAFWYRQSPERMVPNVGTDPGVDLDNPVQERPGEARVHLTPAGRLDHLRIVPARENETDGPPPEVDWRALLAMTGVDLESLRPAEPGVLPLDFADSRAAWEGHYVDQPDIPLIVEAAAFAGKPVSLWIREPWEQREAGSLPSRGRRVVRATFSLSLIAIILAGFLLARRNLRLGRGDRLGASKLAAFTLVMGASYWLIDAHHSPQVNEELELFLRAYPSSVFLAVMVWLVYIALEPFLRSRWPGALISWSRLLAGRVRDPLVGRDILMGACGGLVLLWSTRGDEIASRLFDHPPPAPDLYRLDALLGGRHVVHQILDAIFMPLLLAGGLLFLLLILRVVLRRHWLAVGALVALLSVPTITQIEHPLFGLFLVVKLAMWTAIYLLLSRFGVLSVYVVFVFLFIFDGIPSLDLSRWYAGNVIVLLLFLAAIVAFAFHTSLGSSSRGRSQYPDGAQVGW